VKNLLTQFRLMLIVLVITVVLYPLVVTLVGNAAFPSQAQGSLVKYHGRIVGSRLLGQAFKSACFFQGRPSAVNYSGYSGATNYGPTNPELLKEVKSNLKSFIKENPGVNIKQIPLNILESSASGEDPDILPQAAYIQVPRISRLTGLSSAELGHLIAATEHNSFLGIFGPSRVNVLELNLKLADILAYRSGVKC
jgi:K+-transporting ATPase ATPase C chain